MINKFRNNSDDNLKKFSERKYEANHIGDPGLPLYVEDPIDSNKKIKFNIGFWCFVEVGSVLKWKIFANAKNFSMREGATIYQLDGSNYVEIGTISEVFSNGCSLSYTIIDVDDSFADFRSYSMDVEPEEVHLYTFAYTEDAFKGDEEKFKVVVDDSTKIVNAKYLGKRQEDNENYSYIIETNEYIDETNFGTTVYYLDAQQDNAAILAGKLNAQDPVVHESKTTWRYKFTPIFNIFKKNYMPYVWWTDGE